MSAYALKEKLQKLSKMKLELIINENRSTMLSILGRSRKSAKLSVHKMFLDAPDVVVDAIADYLHGIRNPVLRKYIQGNLDRVEHKIDHRELESVGEIYDLRPMYEAHNRDYFENQLDVAFTWYGKHGRHCRSRITFGQYCDHLKLVKMHRLLDDPYFPEVFVSFVMYHEMLHAVVRGSRPHCKEFRRRERLFKHYDEAIAWEKQNKQHFFKE